MNRHFERNVTCVPLYWCGAYTKTVWRCVRACVRAYVCVCECICMFFVCDSENGLKYVYIIKHSVLCCCFRYFFSILSFYASHRYVERKEKWNQIVRMVGCLMPMVPFKSIEKSRMELNENGNNNSRDKRDTYATPVEESFSSLDRPKISPNSLQSS